MLLNNESLRSSLWTEKRCWMYAYPSGFVHSTPSPPNVPLSSRTFEVSKSRKAINVQVLPSEHLDKCSTGLGIFSDRVVVFVFDSSSRLSFFFFCVVIVLVASSPYVKSASSKAFSFRTSSSHPLPHQASTSRVYDNLPV
jgi:hypothetical protein